MSPLDDDDDDDVDASERDDVDDEEEDNRKKKKKIKRHTENNLCTRARTAGFPTRRASFGVRENEQMVLQLENRRLAGVLRGLSFGEIEIERDRVTPGFTVRRTRTGVLRDGFHERL